MRMEFPYRDSPQVRIVLSYLFWGNERLSVNTGTSEAENQIH